MASELPPPNRNELAAIKKAVKASRTFDYFSSYCRGRFGRERFTAWHEHLSQWYQTYK